ncbi:PilZ domain-containing protein [Oscillibacter sp.]|uniref:PilZ domain-containing protein n=1 Tax=Oscillibacter sp. TaxID=1945593 RepID=UPI003392DD0C
MFHFFKKSVPQPEEEQEPLSEFEQAAQYHCEVRGIDDRPVFLADVKDFDGDSFRLFPTLDADAPSVIYNSHYKLVFRTPHQPIPVWTGRVRGSTYKFWKMDELTRLKDEQRASFRQRVSLSAVVRNLLGLPENGETLTAAYYSRDYDQCEILDVGMGGLQLRSSHSFRMNDLLAVTGLRLYHDPQPFSLPLQVRWVSAGDGAYRCGCAFHSVPEQEERRLCAAMFSLQRASMGRV